MSGFDTDQDATLRPVSVDATPQPIVRVDFVSRVDPDDLTGWPFTIPAVAQIVRDGMAFAPGVTFLVGENGAGKSTIIEAIAMACGLSGEGGTRNTRHQTHATESSLHEHLGVTRDLRADQWAFFLRQETLHGLMTYMTETAARSDGPLHTMSHGESVLQIVQRRFNATGFYLLDEPESGLAFTSCLALAHTLQSIGQGGGQVLCATHSPILTAIPDATILEVGDDGIRSIDWSDIPDVRLWRSFLAEPQRFLRPEEDG